MEASQEGLPAQDPQQDSALQTPQPDQPVPADPETPAEAVDENPAGSTATAGPSGEPAEGTVAPSPYPTSEEQVEAHEQRQRELQAQNDEHNARTGGGVPAPESEPDTSADQA